MKKQITELINCIIYLFMGMQIILGIVWGIANLTKIPGFEESKEVLQMSTTLMVDEYVGFLYPLLIRGITFLLPISGIPACSVLYLLQLGLAYYAYSQFLKRVVFSDKKSNVQLRNKIRFLTGYLISVPVVFQVHMAVLPYSLASSLLILILVRIMERYKTEKQSKPKEFIKTGILCLLCAQICPEYIWLVGILIGIACAFYLFCHKEFAVSLCLMLCLVLVGNGICNSIQPQMEQSGKIQNSPEAVLLKRVVWPNFARFSYFWKGEIRQTWNDTELLILSTYPENVIYDFGPTIDEMFGLEEANNIYWEMIKRSFELDTKQIIFRICKEAGAYFCPPVTTYAQLHGIGATYAGWNYGRMKDYTPGLTEVYVEVALSSWIFMMILLVVAGLLTLKKKEWVPEQRRKYRWWAGGYLAAAVCLVDLWYVLVSAHTSDYKKVLVISIIWTLGMIGLHKMLEERI